MSPELEELTELIVRRFDQLETRLEEGLREQKEALDNVGGYLALKLDQLEERIVRVASDTKALADAFIPAEENERRIRVLEKARIMLEKARDDLRGRADDLENRLYVVQASAAAKGSNGNGHGE